MKKILIVDIPNDAEKDFVVYSVQIANRNNGKAFFRSADIAPAEFTEFVPPNVDQIDNKADEYATVVNSTIDQAFIDGVKWFKSLLG